MYSYKYSKKATSDIIQFINSYKHMYFQLFFDTGLEDENLIIKNYVDLGDKKHFEISKKIKNIFTQKLILGSFSRDTMRFVIISESNSRLFVYYTENHDQLTRTIISIEIYKK